MRRINKLNSGKILETDILWGMAMDDQRVIDATECWIREVVVGLNLCPFAAGPLAGRRIHYQVCGETVPDAIYTALLAEFIAFLELPEDQAETGLFIVPRGLEGFETYLEVVDAADDVIGQVGLTGVIQLASFHPDYRFAEAPADDAANYTNRSPYPMFHLIREAALQEALANYPDPETIPLRNIETLRGLGAEVMRERLVACGGAGDD